MVRISSLQGMRILTSAALLCSTSVAAQQPLRSVLLSGRVEYSDHQPSADATVSVGSRSATTDAQGRYSFIVPVGLDIIEVRSIASAVIDFSLSLDIRSERELNIQLRNDGRITVTAKDEAFSPDPATQGYSHDDLLDANPGRPGVPVSVPGFPAETASGGIKAPQYFAPGVAGDHGEPIGQYVSIGSFLLPNNLTANAHGNGYADPNFLVSSIVGGVLVDGGAFNVRYGDHAVNLAVAYDLRSDVTTSFQTSTTGKDVSFGGNLNLGKSTWLAAEGLLGNGWLARPEEREQYKINVLHGWSAGKHQFSLFGAAYYGFSRIPGLIPLSYPVSGETIDSRQSDLTHTTVAALVDRWQPTGASTLTSGLFFRTYSLKLRSNFGDGLIQQSEFRTIVGGSSNFSRVLSRHWTVLAGIEAKREAPRGLNLEHLDESTQQFSLVSSNDLTIYNASPFAAVTGKLLPEVHLYAGARYDRLCFESADRLQAANSFTACPGFTSPKINITVGSLEGGALPQLGLSFAKAFHANDPRIGSGGGRGSLIASAREYQAVAAKAVGTIQARLVLGQVRTSAEFAKIDPDTGLQEDVGPALNRFLTLQVNQRTARRFWQVSWSEANARDLSDGTPLPEAPRMIIDAVVGTNRLPLGLATKTEFEYVKAKPLGDGFTGSALREVRMELSRSFKDGIWYASIDGQCVQGFSGQTLETLALDPNTPATEQRVGVPASSYATLSLRYNFNRPQGTE